MSRGYYKRRRGAVEHIEAGTIDLLEDGIHDYLSLKANLVIGNGHRLPAGVVSTSAPALHAYCKRVSERTIQRLLNHLEEIGWLKFSPWRTPGKRGNYMVVICRASVHDLSGNEYRVNGEKTTDWRRPIYEAVGEVSESCPPSVGELSGDREVRAREERSRKNPAAKPARPADPRFQAFFSYAYESYRAKHRRTPIWTDKDKNALKSLLRGQSLAALPLERLKNLWENYSASTERFTVKQGDSLAYFCANPDKFSEGPLHEKGQIDATNVTARSLANSGLGPDGRIKTILN